MSEMSNNDRAKGETRGVGGATLSIKGPSQDAATVVNTPGLQQFTPEQIKQHCQKIFHMHWSARPDGELLFEGVLIIRQLQGIQTTTQPEITQPQASSEA